MRIVLEGPDNAGKTTLAQQLVTGCSKPVMYFHPGGRPADDNHERVCVQEQLRLLSREAVIVIDRVTPISQQVYNPDPDMAAQRCAWLDTFVGMALFVYCRPSTDRLLRTQDLTWRPDESDEHKQKIISRQHEFVERYDDIMRTVPCIHYDFEDPSADGLRALLIAGLGDDGEAQSQLRRLVRGVRL